MTRFSDEILMRRADGELPPDQCQEIDDAAAADAELAHRLQRMRASRDQARDAFPASSDTRDAALAALIARSASSTVPGLGRPAVGGKILERLKLGPGPILVWGTAAAAAFAAGLVVAPLLPSSGALLDRSGNLTEPALVRVLDERLAADGADRTGHAIGLTYRDTRGVWCRTFTALDAGYSGLACREGGAWRLRALASAEISGGELRTATTSTPAAILAAVDETIAADPVDAAGEARARSDGWDQPAPSSGSAEE